MSAKSKTTPLRNKLEKLESLMAWFESDDLDVEEALEKFKEADALAKEIEEQLQALENQVTVLKERFDLPS